MGAPIPGRKVDIWLMRRGIKEKREELRQSIIPTGDFQRDWADRHKDTEILEDYGKYRTQLVTNLSSFYMKNLSIQSEDEAEQTFHERMVAKKELNQQRAEILEIFKEDQKMFQSILDRKETSKALRDYVIMLENEVVLAAGIIEAQALQSKSNPRSQDPLPQHLPLEPINHEGLENIH